MKSRDTLPERLLSSALDELGYPHERNLASLPGTPDIVMSSHRVAVFVHGCFWHRHHECNRARVPMKDTSVWLDRFADIVERDQRTIGLLKARGWFPRIAWECEILNDHVAAAGRVIESIDAWLVWNSVSSPATA